MRKKPVVHLTWCVFFAIIQYVSAYTKEFAYTFFFIPQQTCMYYVIMLLHKYELIFAVNLIKKFQMLFEQNVASYVT